MTTRANLASRRSRNAKSLSVNQTQDCDSESETAVTSTSGQKVMASLPAAKTGRRKQASRSPGLSRSRGTSRSPGVSKSVALSESDIVSISPMVFKAPVAGFLEASKSHVKSPLVSESSEATDLRIASKVPGVGKQPSPSKKRRCQATVVKEEQAKEEEDAAGDRSTEDQSPGSQRLLMREWLLQEVEQNRIPGLGWLDKERRLIRIPWIHASKDGWSKDSHCKLFENWAIYTGKYDASKQKPDPKRWKANFRCALHSLADIEEEPDMSKKNGMEGYRVYRVKDAVDRKGHRRHKVLNHAPAVESQTHSSVGPSVHYRSEVICNSEEHIHQHVQPLELCRTTPIPVTSNSSACMQDFTDSLGQPILIVPPQGVFIACSAEFIRDTVCPSDGIYTSLSNMVVANGDGVEVAVVVDNQETLSSMESVSSGRNCTSERDIVSLRNLDHSYFKVQIPTTVEDFVDDDGASSPGQNPKVQRKSTLR